LIFSLTDSFAESWSLLWMCVVVVITGILLLLIVQNSEPISTNFGDFTGKITLLVGCKVYPSLSVAVIHNNVNQHLEFKWIIWYESNIVCTSRRTTVYVSNMTT
jgi:hypothetical protein